MRLTKRQRIAADHACTAMLSGAPGEGDWTDEQVTARDLEGASSKLQGAEESEGERMVLAAVARALRMGEGLSLSAQEVVALAQALGLKEATSP